MGERRGAYRILVGRPEGRQPLGRPRRRWEDNIKMDLQALLLVCGRLTHTLAEDVGNEIPMNQHTFVRVLSKLS
jgi:hypothetical protein